MKQHISKKMIIYSDLDNTMIYSLRRPIGEEKICVEHHEGKALSFMTEASSEMLKEVKLKSLFVPLTTRDIRQYRRIHLGIGVPSYALVCNGGVLLIDGQEDPSWYQESLALIQDCQADLRNGASYLEEDPYRIFEVRNVQGLFLFTKSAEPEKTVKWLKEKLDVSKIIIYAIGKKVYIVPKRLSKGEAIKRFSQKIQQGYSLAVGDSEMDLSMMNEVDLGILPRALKGQWNREGQVIYIEDDIFSDGALSYIKKKIEETSVCEKNMLG